MLSTLIKIRLKALFSVSFTRMSKSKKKLGPIKKILIALLVMYVAGALLMSFSMLCNQVAGSFCGAGQDWLYFVFAGILCVMFGVFGSVFATQSLLFEATDNELLLSMPIPPSYILASRFSALIILDYIYSIFMLIPAVFVYFLYVPFDALRLVVCIAAGLLIPLVSITLCCVFGWLLTLITAGRRKKQYIQTAIMLVFLLGYMAFVTNSQAILVSVTQNGAALSLIAQKILPPVGCYALACANGSPVQLLFLALWAFIPLAAVYVILAKTFLKLAGKMNFSGAKVKYVRRELKASGKRAAFTKKELSKFFGTPNYFINSGIGAILALVYAAVLLIKGGDILAAIPLPEVSAELVPIIVVTALLFCAMMTNTTAPSLSLEGRSISLLKSMPLSPADIFSAKIAANLIIALPPIFVSGIICSLSVDADLLTRLFMVIIAPCAIVFGSTLGMLLNLRFPRFEWMNETVVIKQSASVMISTFASIGIVLVFTALYAAVLQKYISAAVYLAAFSVIFLAAAALIYRRVLSKSEKEFITL